MPNHYNQAPDLQLPSGRNQPWYFRRVTIALGTGVVLVSLLLVMIRQESNSTPLPMTEKAAFQTETESPLKSPEPLPKEALVLPSGVPSDVREFHQGKAIASGQIEKLRAIDMGELIKLSRSTNIKKLIKSDPSLLVTFARELEANPSSTNLLLLKAEIEIQSRRYNSAIKIYTQIIKTSPDLPQLKYCRATAYSLNSEFSHALSDLREAISKQPELGSIARKDVRFRSIATSTAFKAIIANDPTHHLTKSLPRQRIPPDQKSTKPRQ